MKNSGKSSKPIIAAHSTKQNGNQPAPPANDNRTRSRVSRAPKRNTAKMKALVLERISDGILAFDSEMNHVYVNERAGELLGREPEALLGTNFWEVYPESTGSAFADACQRAFETQTMIPFDGYFPPTDSWLEGRVYPSDDGLSVLLSDRAQTKQEEIVETGEVAEQGRELSELPIQNPNPVMRFTRDGELLFANPASTPILESWKGQTPQGIPSELRKLLQSILESGSNQELEFQNAGKVYSALLVPVGEAGYVNLYFNDITERKQAQESVQALIHQATTGITRTSLDGKFVFVNQAFCDMLGYSESELLGRTIWEISYPADIAKNQRLFERLAADGEPYQLEKRLLRRNGTILWVSVGASPLRDGEGNIYAAVSIIVDITRRKRAEESLLDSARRTLYLSSLSDTIRPLSSPAQIEIEATRILALRLKANRVAYAQVKQEGMAILRNSYADGVAELTGEFNIDQFIPRGMLPKFHMGRAIVTTGVDLASLNGEPLSSAKEPSSTIRSQIIIPLIRVGEPVAALIVQQTDSRAWTNEEIHLVEETAERMQAAIERARAEQDLRESEKRFRILSNTVPSMVWSTAPDGTIQYLNEHWHYYTGLSEEESISSWAELALHPDDYEQCLAAWNHALATVPDEYLYEVRYRRYDGEYRWFQSRATPARDENGNVVAWYGVSTDIHDRVEREAELQKVINHTPFMLTRCSRNLRYQFVSQAYAEMLGRTSQEIAGKSIMEVMGEEGLKTILPYVEQVLQGKRVEYEAEVPFQGIQAPFLHVTYMPDYDGQGNVIGWFASITDITEQKQTEEALRIENERFMRFVNSNIVGIVIGDANGKVVLANDYYLDLLGVSRQDFIEGKVDWKKFTPPEWLPADERAIQELRERGVAEPYEKEYIRTDGRRVPVYIADASLPGEEIAAFVLDMTERKHAEEALRASEEKYRRIVETANEGFWEIDKDVQTVFVNPRMAEMLGYRPDEIIGHSVFEFLVPEDNVEGQNRLERAKSGIAARSAEFRYRRKDGSILWALASTKPQLDEHGNFMGSVAMLTDISERKQYERSLIEYARQQTSLYRLANQLNRMQTFDQMYKASLDAIRKALLCDRASILLFDDKGVMSFVAWHALSDEYRKATEGHSPWKADAKNPVPIAFNDLRTADLSDSLREVIAKEGIGSLAFIPMMFQRRLIGKFMVYFNAPHTFRETELDISLTISHQLASAIDRKRAEQALLESQERFVRFMEYLPGLAWIKDLEGRYVFANATSEKAFNTPQKDLYGKTDREVFPAEVAEQFKQNDERALMEGRGIQVVETLPQSDGVVHYSLVSKFPIPGPDGAMALIGGTAFDITERVHMEDALREARQQAEETADRMARLQEVTAALAAASNPMQLAEFILEQGIHATGARAGILVELINEGKDLKMIAAVGYPSAAVYSEPVPLSAPTPMSDCIRTRQAIWIESQEEFTAQYPTLAETRRAFGNQATVALPLIIGDRVVGGLAFSFVEPREFLIEERGFFLAVAQQCAQGLQRAHAEEALRESEERYRAIVNQATAGIIRKDANGKLLFVNDAFCNMLGYRDTELIDKTIWQLTYEEDIAESQERFKRLIMEGISFQLEKRLLRRDGSILWVTVSVSPVMDATGKPQSAVSVYVDITERKQAENRLILLGEISEYIRNLEEPNKLMSTVANAVGKHLHVKRALFNEINVEKDIEIVHSDYHDGLESVAGLHTITEYSSLTTKEMEKGKTVVNTDSKTDPRTAKDYERTYLVTGERAYIAVPLMREERWVASLWVSDDKPRVWSREEISLLETIAERTWTATEKLRINAALRELNTELEERVKQRTAELQTAIEFLRESEAISRLIIESMPDAIVITDKDGFIVHCNTQVETLFGFAPSEVLGQKVEMLIPQRFHQSHIRERLAYNEQRHRRSMGLGRELFGHRKDGSEFPVDVMLSPISNNTTWDVMITIRDNTEQKQAQEAVRSNEEKLRKVFEILPVGISFLGNDGQILDMNSALSNILGLSKRELMEGKHKPRRYIRTDGVPMSASELASTRAKVEQKTIYNVETGILKENGETIWTSVNAAPVDVADVDVVVATIDITERKKAEDALHQNRERLRTLSRRLVEVQEEERQALARELHDRVGQNLAALNLNLNILRSQLSTEVLQIIGTRLDDSVSLVNQILTITRNVMADLRSNVLDDYGLESALREFAEQFTQRTGVEVVSDKSVTTISRLDPNIEMTLLRIAQEALTNVARHAQASKATISVSMDDESVYMSIQDDGIGILSWQKANQPGSHGLRIIRERAEAFGGSLSVNSTYKKGTRIEVKIPLSSASPHKVPRERRS